MLQKTQEDTEFSSIIRLSPSLLTMANSVAEIFRHFRWKSVAIIGTGKKSIYYYILLINDKSDFTNIQIYFSFLFYVNVGIVKRCMNIP